MTIDPKVYDSDYFLKGKESGKSLYENYRWMPDLTIPMAQTIIDHLGMQRGEKVMDFGCARGYLVKAFRYFGYEAYGLDVSLWAIQNADLEIKTYCHLVKDCPLVEWPNIDWIIAKDVLEHIEYVEAMIQNLMKCANKGLFVVVPLTKFDKTSKYIIEDYEKDVTHIQRFTLPTWASFFIKSGWKVEISYRLKGVKDNYYKEGWETGNGFITCRRISE